MERYRLTYECADNVVLYDAQEGIYFSLEGATEAYELMLDELKSKANHFSIRLALTKPNIYANVYYEVEIIKQYEQ